MVKVEQDDAAPQLEPPPPSPLPVDGDDDYDDDEDDDEEEAGNVWGGEPKRNKGPWKPEEDKVLRDYVEEHGEGNWNRLRDNAGLDRCGKSCRLRWTNHLKPGLRKGPFDKEEVDKILRMHKKWGNKWASMAMRLPGRTDNEIKNFWNTRLKRCKKANEPIYPEHLTSQTSNQDMKFDTPEESHFTKQPNKVPLENIFRMDLFCKHLKKRNLPMRACEVPIAGSADPSCLPVDAMNPLKRLKPTERIASDYNGNLSIGQIADESQKFARSTSFNYGMTEKQLLGNANISGRPVIESQKFACSTSFNYGMTENQLLGNANISGPPVIESQKFACSTSFHYGMTENQLLGNANISGRPVIEPQKFARSTSFNYATTQNQLLGNANISGHPVIDGNPSTSWTPQGPMNTELPSVQNFNCGLNNARFCDYPSDSLIEQSNIFFEPPPNLDAIFSKGDATDYPLKSQGAFEQSLLPFPSNQVLQSNADIMRNSLYPTPNGDQSKAEGCPLSEILYPIPNGDQAKAEGCPLSEILYPIPNGDQAKAEGCPLSEILYSIPNGDQAKAEGCPLSEIQALETPSSSNAIIAESKLYQDSGITGEHLSSLTDFDTLGASEPANIDGNNWEAKLFSDSMLDDYDVSQYLA